MAHLIMRLVVLFLIPQSSNAQAKQIFYTSDKMPSATFKNIFNEPGTSVSLSDYKGKLIIIDFWNRWCGTCIEAFPKMEKLQKEFGDKIKIFLVTTDKKEDVTRLFKRVKQPALTIIYGDTLLNKMFPHATVPHHVWINPNGRIQFITDGYNATANNITKVLESQVVKLSVKNELLDIDDNADLWREGGGRFQKYITNYSFIMSKISENGHSGFSYLIDTVNKTRGFKLLNISLLDFIRVAFGESINFQSSEFALNNRVVFMGTEVENYFNYPAETDSIATWEARNIICYESKWKIQDDKLAYQFLKDDVNRFISFSVKTEIRETACYLLKKTTGFTSSKYSDKEKAVEYTDSSFRLKNMPAESLVNSLNLLDIFKKMPVVNDVNDNTTIDVYLKNAFSDIEILKKQLQQNGLQLVEGSKKIKMLVIGQK